MSKTIVIVGKANCAFCDRAKALCEQKNIGYEYKKIHDDVSIEQLQEIAQIKIQTVPQIYISEDGLNTYIGGYTQFEQYVKENN